METLIGLFVLTILPWLSLWYAVRHGPFANKWWRGETMLGIFFTGPIGFFVGLGWGWLRAGARRRRGR